MTVQYALESISEPGFCMSGIDNQGVVQKIVFPTIEEAEEFLWKRDALTVIDAKIAIVVDGEVF